MARPQSKTGAERASTNTPQPRSPSSGTNRARAEFSGLPRAFHLLIKESGSPLLTSGGAERFEQTVVIAQMRGEQPLLFAERALERISILTRATSHVGAVTLQAGPRHDPAMDRARQNLLLALLGAQQSSRPLCEVLIEAPGTAAGEGATQLLGLAEALLARAGVLGVPVRVRFRDQDPPTPEADSGVFWTRPTRG